MQRASDAAVFEAMCQNMGRSLMPAVRYIIDNAG
jgi:hypothetical protein